MRYLVPHHGIELRQARAIAMGKATLATGQKPSPEILAKARRVDIRLLTPCASSSRPSGLVTLAVTDERGCEVRWVDPL
jgi:hypothetical protein